MKHLLCLLLAIVSMLSAQASEKRLVVELGSNRQTYKLGDRISLSARLSNRSENSVTLYRYLLWGQRGGLVLEVMDAAQQEVQPEQLDEDSVIPSTLDDPASFLELPPDYSWGVLREDKTTNLFHKPGRYTIRLKYRSPVPSKYFPKPANAWATENGPLVSLPIGIEIR